MVQTSSRQYPIFFETDFFLDNLSALLELLNNKQVAIITDEHVAKYHLENFSEILPGKQIIKIVIPAGDNNKNLYNFEQIITILAKEHFRKNAILIALGGGMIGDLTGFSAACYQRGIDFIQIPTSLLAQVDASVGGKTAINHPLAKNLIGAFHQPMAVFINLKILETLPEREFISGLAEVIKYGLIADNAFLQWIDENHQYILKRDQNVLMCLVKKCCEIKQSIVAKDEYDNDIRQILNFGHTFAHAIETGLAYQYLHGEAVAMGMIAASYLSWQQKNISDVEFKYIFNLLTRIGLPTKWPKEMSVEKTIEIMQHDKKNMADGITLILLKQLGQAYVCQNIAIQEIEDALRGGLSAH